MTQGSTTCPGTSGETPSLAGVGVPRDPPSEGDPDPARQRGKAWKVVFLERMEQPHVGL